MKKVGLGRGKKYFRYFCPWGKIPATGGAASDQHDVRGGSVYDHLASSVSCTARGWANKTCLTVSFFFQCRTRLDQKSRTRSPTFYCVSQKTTVKKQDSESYFFGQM